jgi:GntR family transcriptional regulator
MFTHPKAVPNTPIPRYVAVADQLRKRIAGGEWPAGHYLPSLQHLADAFGVARMTARQAVQLLVAEGLLASQRGQGTYVISTLQPIKTAPLASSLRELGDTYRDLVPRILTIDEKPRPLPGEESGMAVGYVYMRRLHMHESRPYCVISLYIAQWIFALNPQRYRDHAVVLALLEQPEVQIAQARQTLTIGTASAETASLLRVPNESPTAEVLRTFRGPDGEIIYYAEVTYRGDAIRLEIDLKD